jgi:hypothetical protein
MLTKPISYASRIEDSRQTIKIRNSSAYYKLSRMMSWDKLKSFDIRGGTKNPLLQLDSSPMLRQISKGRHNGESPTPLESNIMKNPRQ